MLRRLSPRRPIVVAALLASSPALAQTPPTPYVLPVAPAAPTQASTGATDLATGIVEGAARIEKESKDATELSVSFGGQQTGGNARLLAVTGASRFRLRRGVRQLRLALAANYARTAVPNENWNTTVRNVQGLARYDRFWGDVTLFFGLQGRHDEVQGLDLRAQADPGVGYYFVNTKRQLFWSEGGYDLLYDLRDQNSRLVVDGDQNPVLDAGGRPQFVDRSRILHSARFFVGYQIVLRGENSKFTGGVEFLQGLSDTNVYRLNTDVTLSSKLVDDLSVAITLTSRHESRPLPGKLPWDLSTSISLVYPLL